MIYPITPTTLKETELQRRPALQEPTILHCQRAYEHVYRCVLKKKKSKTLAGLEGSEAFIEALPPLIGLDNISTFIACITYGVAVGVLLEQTVPILLRAARCVMDAIALKAKLAEKPAQPTVDQVSVAQPSATQAPAPQPSAPRPKVSRPKAARPKASPPKVAPPKSAQPTMPLPSVPQPSASQATVTQSAESQPSASQDSVAQPKETSQKIPENHNQLNTNDLAKLQPHAPLKTNKLHPPKKSENPHISSEKAPLPSQNPPLPSQNSLASSVTSPQSTLECP